MMSTSQILCFILQILFYMLGNFQKLSFCFASSFSSRSQILPISLFNPSAWFCVSFKMFQS